MGGGLLGINTMNLVLKILMQDMTAEMVVVVAGGLVVMAKMEDELMGVVVAIMFILMMKNLSGLMRITLQMMGCTGGAMIIGGVLIMEIKEHHHGQRKSSAGPRILRAL